MKKNLRISLVVGLILLCVLSTSCLAGESIGTVQVSPTPLPVTQPDVVHEENQLGVMPYMNLIAEGAVAGHTEFHQFGYTSSTTSTQSDIWLGTGTYAWPTTAQQMRLVSSSTQDSSTGTGIRTVTIYYLDGSYNSHTETVTLSGTVAVDTVATNIFRVNNFVATTTGSSGQAVGQISLGNLAGTVFYRYIATGYTQDRGSMFTVPLGMKLYINDFYLGVGQLTATQTSRATLRATYNPFSKSMSTAGLVFYPLAEIESTNGSVVRTFDVPMYVPATVDVKISIVNSNSATGDAEGSYRGWLQSN